MDTQDSTTPFNLENTLPVPDAPGIWFYHATRLPTEVIRKEDGELYFKGSGETPEEMKVSDFAKIKAANPQLASFSFTKLRLPLNRTISPN